jgi:hypothetical protein
MGRFWLLAPDVAKVAAPPRDRAVTRQAHRTRNAPASVWAFIVNMDIQLIPEKGET